MHAPNLAEQLVDYFDHLLPPQWYDPGSFVNVTSDLGTGPCTFRCAVKETTVVGVLVEAHDPIDGTDGRLIFLPWGSIRLIVGIERRDSDEP